MWRIYRLPTLRYASCPTNSHCMGSQLFPKHACSGAMTYCFSVPFAFSELLLWLMECWSFSEVFAMRKQRLAASELSDFRNSTYYRVEVGNKTHDWFLQAGPGLRMNPSTHVYDR